MARIDWDLQKYDGEFKKAGMARIKRAAEVIRDMAKTNCIAGTINRPARKHWVNNGHLEDASPESSANIWTAREAGAMRETIRVVETREDRGRGFDQERDNVRVYAGNFKTWYAVQMEYGRGGWKGGARPFMRKALTAAPSRIRPIIEGTE